MHDISTGQYSAINKAPSLPPRLYSWSDVEDDDDELFLSDDEGDSSAMTLPQKSKVTDGLLNQVNDDTNAKYVVYLLIYILLEARLCLKSQPVY